MELNYIFFNGRIASGKDTQAEIVNSHIPKSVIISPGNIYRQAVKRIGDGATFGELIDPYIESINQGGLLPDEIIMTMLDSTVKKKYEEGNSTFLFTGFPRTLNQLYEVDSWTESENARSIFLCYAVLDRHSIQRSQDRMMHADIPRAEDSIDSVIERLAGYKKYTEPVIRRLLKEGRLDIIKSNHSIEEVAQRTRDILSGKYGLEYQSLRDEVKLGEVAHYFRR